MHKISYAKRWNSDGTCFSQCITITEKEFNFAMQEKSKTVWSDKLENAYLHVQREMENNIYFANLNQFYFIAHILGIFKEKVV